MVKSTSSASGTFDKPATLTERNIETLIPLDIGVFEVLLVFTFTIGSTIPGRQNLHLRTDPGMQPVRSLTKQRACGYLYQTMLNSIA